MNSTVLVHLGDGRKLFVNIYFEQRTKYFELKIGKTVVYPPKMNKFRTIKRGYK
jgi:hypothetical protein